MIAIGLLFVRMLCDYFKSRPQLEAEIVILRHHDHLLVFNADHLRRILAKYATYYNEVRTHVSLGKDAPCRWPVERFGDIVAYPVLGGLHHRYARI